MASLPSAKVYVYVCGEKRTPVAGWPGRKAIPSLARAGKMVTQFDGVFVRLHVMAAGVVSLCYQHITRQFAAVLLFV